MNKTIIASLIGLAFTNTAFSAENIQLDDVVVTAARLPQTRESVIADVTVIGSEEIKRGGQSTLVELLQQQPGVEITNTGGAGKASGIFMRGTNTNHVVVVVDGVRIHSATAGTATFENLPIQLIDRIEILRGPASSLYGPDAIGGVIQIFTKKGLDGFKTFANLGYGSYDTSIANAGVRGKVGDTSYALNIAASDIGGFSAFDANNSALNDKDGYRNLATSANVSHTIAPGHELGIQFFNSDGTTRFDNRFNTTPAFSSKARIEQQSIAVFSNNQLTSFWLSKLRVAESRDNSKTFDETSLAGGDIFNTRQTQINWQNDLRLPIGTLTLMYDRLEDKVDSSTDFNKTKRSDEGYMVSYLANIDAHNLHASLREDHNSQFGNYVTGGLGYGYAFNKNWRMTGSYGSAFKAPTFNDLYFPDSFGFQTSDPNLKPEKSDNIEASLRFSDETSSASVTAYENKIRDLIVLDSAFIPANINKATIRGITLAASKQLDRLDISASADIQSPRNSESNNLLVRRANRHGQINLGYTLQSWRLGAEVITSSARYNDAANNLRMGGYTILNLVSQYKINADWSVQARANNVLDKHYTLAFEGNPATTGFAYNTPGANLFVNIRYEPQ
jgi:vitamin B12 transporter